MRQRRTPYTVSLPRDKSTWFDTWLERNHRRPSDEFEEYIDKLMEADQGAKKNGAHKDPQAKRA